MTVHIEQRNGVLAAQLADKDSHPQALEEQQRWHRLAACRRR
ncbi:hypothetical protein PO002_45265 [Cupriavidus necator]